MKISTERAKEMMNSRTAQIKDSANSVNADILSVLFSNDTILDWKQATGAQVADGFLYLENLRKILLDWLPDKEAANALEEIITDYSVKCEEIGFRDGFNLALNILVQGMRFPTLPG